MTGPRRAIAENVFGILGTICWSGQLLLQIWKSWKEKSTKGFSPYLILIWAIASVPMGAYALLQGLNIPLCVRPQIFGFLCIVSWGQCRYYGLGSSSLKSTLMTAGLVLLLAALELIIIRPIHSPHYEYIATTICGALSATLILAALILQYYEIYKCKAVIGISLTFLLIDMAGGLFNDLSLVFVETFDVLAAATYALPIVSWLSPVSAIVCVLNHSKSSTASSSYWVGCSSFQRGDENTKAHHQRISTTATQKLEYAIEQRWNFHD